MQIQGSKKQLCLKNTESLTCILPIVNSTHSYPHTVPAYLKILARLLETDNCAFAMHQGFVFVAKPVAHYGKGLTL